MLSDRVTNIATRAAGLMVLAIGLAHMAMPSFGYAPNVLAAIPEPQRDHFVFLGTYAIGFFLLSFGVTTLFADPRSRNTLETVFFGSMVVVWGARLLLEFIYPVDLSLFFVANPHPMLVAAISLIWAGYIVGFLSRVLRTDRRFETC